MRRIAYLAGGSALAMAAAIGFGGVAAAQEEPTAVEEVVITGSLIAGTPEDAALPVDVIGAEELSKQGSPSTVELLKSLSVSSGVLGDTNQFDARAQGSEGSGSVNLRGIGAARTLVLLNGRRMTPNPFGQVGTGIVDTNTIPVAAIGRIDAGLPRVQALGQRRAKLDLGEIQRVGVRQRCITQRRSRQAAPVGGGRDAHLALQVLAPDGGGPTARLGAGDRAQRHQHLVPVGVVHVGGHRQGQQVLGDPPLVRA